MGLEILNNSVSLYFTMSFLISKSQDILVKRVIDFPIFQFLNFKSITILTPYCIVNYALPMTYFANLDFVVAVAVGTGHCCGDDATDATVLHTVPAVGPPSQL